MPNCPQIMISGTTDKVIRIEKDLESNIEEARKITSTFFKNNKKRTEHFPGNTQWAFYDRFLLDIAIPYCKYRHLFDSCMGAKKVKCESPPADLIPLIETFCQFHHIPLEIQSREKISFSLRIKLFLFSFWRIYLVLHSLVVLLSFLLIRRKNLVVIWTGDYLNKIGIMDPRLGNLEEKLKQEKMTVLPFIRASGMAPKTSIKNLIRRRGRGIYYEYINELIRVKKDCTFLQHDSFFEAAFFNLYHHNAFELEAQVLFWEKIFKKLNPKSFVVWFLSFRTAPLLWGAKKAKIKTIGFMHGVSVLSYMGHEFMPEYEGDPIGTDVFGVWSKWWQNYFVQNSGIYPKGGIEVSGPLKQFSESLKISETLTPEKKLRVYIISEAHLPTEQLISYLQKMVMDPRIEIIIKVRPFGVDHAWENLKKSPFFQKHQLRSSTAPSPQCFKDADLVMGTHSTAVLESLVLNRPIILFNTPKWGDYFSFNSMYDGSCPFWASSPDQIIEKIQTVTSMPRDWYKLYGKFFGNSSGADWIINQIKN